MSTGDLLIHELPCRTPYLHINDTYCWTTVFSNLTQSKFLVATFCVTNETTSLQLQSYKLSRDPANYTTASYHILKVGLHAIYFKPHFAAFNLYQGLQSRSARWFHWLLFSHSVDKELLISNSLLLYYDIYNSPVIYK